MRVQLGKEEATMNSKTFHDELDIKPPLRRTLNIDCGGSEALVSQENYENTK